MTHLKMGEGPMFMCTLLLKNHLTLVHMHTMSPCLYFIRALMYTYLHELIAVFNILLQ